MRQKFTLSSVWGRLCLAASLPTLLLLAGTAQADYFMQIKDNNGTVLTGSSLVDGYQGFIEISSFSWGITFPATPGSGGGRAGKADFSDFSWTQVLDASTVKQFAAAAPGEPLNQVVVDFTRADKGQQQTYFQMTFSDAIFSSISLVGGGDIPTESASIAYDKVQLEYWPQGGDPPETATFNLLTGKGSLTDIVALFALGEGGPAGLPGAPIGAVPEPSSWLMVGAGFALVVGLAGRRRGASPRRVALAG